MCNKNRILQFTLALFIISSSITSCEKESELVSAKKYNNNQTHTSTKFEGSKTIELTLYINKNFTKQKIYSEIEVFLKSKDLILINKEWEDISLNHFIFNEKNDQFEKLNSKIENIEYSNNSMQDHLITVDNVEWNINMNQSAKLTDRAVTIVIVSSIDGPDSPDDET